ncbi:outer membrane protein assembly factor BamD [Paroceanicella profunda]|uniref:Outer membrane protein assembly factor BamD n=1 Tax=Paroceanicella profunda TaxID=2579971 RepID=A0A5B8FPQ7_9RHOB|nr:outer membrane protein assembly factor BamD [Paroceanicella profunda]QDL90496.1 outer membrane protein assembly factor BamD [Paroceanicella profunda]
MAQFGKALKGASCAFLILLAGCSGGDNEQVTQDDRPADQIYADAEAQLDRGNAEEAGQLFDDVERLYPYSSWAKRAMIMSAYAYYRGQQFDKAEQAARRYLDFYPADKDAAYAQYLIGLSYYDQIVDVGRDQELTLKALRALRETELRYPDTEYARQAKLKYDLAMDHLAGKEMAIGRYYLKNGHYLAAINRFRAVIEEYQTTSQTAEALHRLVESYLALGLTDEAQTAGAILGHNFSASPWYQDSYTLLTNNGLRPEASGTGWLRSIYDQVVLGRWL